MGVGLIILLSSFVIFVAYLWVNNLEKQANESIREELERNVCNCLGIISDNGSELVVMNVNCAYVENLSLRAGNNYYNTSSTLYFEDFAVISYESSFPFLIFTYNSCSEIINK